MKIWIDDCRPAPEGWMWIKSVNEAINYITYSKASQGMIDEFSIEIISLDHDAGDYFSQGGDYIRILDWLEKMGWSYPIHIHTANSVGELNMRRIIQRNNWEEVIL